MSVKICSLNVEGDKHLDLVLNFLQVEHPDVACLQELYQADVAVIERATGMQGHVLPLVRMEQENNYGFNPRGSFGLGIFISPDAKFVGNPLSSYYFGNPANMPVFDLPNSLCRALFCVQIVKQSQKYSVCTTHFTWSPAGQADEHQRRDLAGLVLAIGQLRQQLEARSAGEGGASSDGQGLLFDLVLPDPFPEINTWRQGLCLVPGFPFGCDDTPVGQLFAFAQQYEFFGNEANFIFGNKNDAKQLKQAAIKHEPK